jgi:hypothetical protein
MTGLRAFHAGIAAALILGCSISARADDPAIGRDHFRIVERRQGEVVSLRVQLIDCTEATIALNLTLTNMEASRPLPIIVDVEAPGAEVVRIAPIDLRFQHQYRYSFTGQVGKRPRRGEPAPARLQAQVYTLPYDRDASFMVSQGRIGRSSHLKGSDDENAIDWLMPVGTPVRAARAGTVIALRGDSTVSGLDPAFKAGGNHVVVKHDDGTMGQYLHLKAGGVAVKLGQKVRVGDPIGLSGNTGYTDQPHLHFIVFYNLDGKRRRTVPVLFRTRDGKDDPLEEGKVY